MIMIIYHHFWTCDFTFESTFLNFDSLKLCSSTSFFLFEAFSGFTGICTLGGDFFESLASMFITASLSFFASSSFSAYTLQITSLMGVDGLDSTTSTCLTLRKWNLRWGWKRRSISVLLWPWLWSRYLFENWWFAAWRTGYFGINTSVFDALSVHGNKIFGGLFDLGALGLLPTGHN